MKATVCRLMLFVVVLASVVQAATAHYDDVHYALTYCVARRVGYTPIQAHRIASADVSVDYSTRTEPVQSKIPVFTSEWGFQEPRWRFHAMNHAMTMFEADATNPIRFTREAPSDSEHRLRVSMQMLTLFQDAIKYRNPGAFMHFSQDRVPHAGYDAGYGHWNPFATSGTHGGTTDWLSFRDDDAAVQLYLNTASQLAYYMSKAGLDRQRPTILADDAAARGLMSRLHQVNSPAPKSIVSDGQNEAAAYMLFVPQRWISLDEETREFVDAAIFATTPPTSDELGGLLDPKRTAYENLRRFPRHFWPHNDGPNLRAAVGVVNEALAADGMSETENGGGIPAEAFAYTIAAPLGHSGDHYDREHFWRWVIFGDLQITFEYPENAGGAPSELTIWLESTRKGADRYALVDKATVSPSQKTIEYERLPLGQLEIEWRTAGKVVKEKVFLNRDKHTVALSAKPKPQTDYAAVLRESASTLQWSNQYAPAPEVIKLSSEGNKPVTRYTIAGHIGTEGSGEIQLAVLGDADQAARFLADRLMLMAKGDLLDLEVGGADQACRVPSNPQPNTFGQVVCTYHARSGNVVILTHTKGSADNVAEGLNNLQTFLRVLDKAHKR